MNSLVNSLAQWLFIIDHVSTISYLQQKRIETLYKLWPGLEGSSSVKMIIDSRYHKTLKIKLKPTKFNCLEPGF